MTAREAELERALAVAKEAIQQQNDFINALSEQAAPLATVVEVNGSHVTVSSAGSLLQINKVKEVKPGDTVALVSQTMQIRDVLPRGRVTGLKGTVKHTLSGRALVQIDNGEYLVQCDHKVEAGSIVITDTSRSVVLDVIEAPPSPNKYVLDERVSWAEVGGQEDAKAALREAIEMPYKHRELYKKYGKKGVKGVLLYGPPGCGKTLLARAAATSLAETHGQSGKTGFIYVKGPELLSMWVGETERAIREMFHTARDHHKRHGHPALIFIDEADAILAGRSGPDGRGHMAMTIVPQFLSEMDGMDDSGAIVLLATNRPDVLDSAVVREGRVDRKVKVVRPSEDQVEEIAKIHMKGRPARNPDAIAATVALELFRPDREVAARDETPVGRVCLTVADLCSGAVVAGAIEQATTKALMRDVDSGKSSPTGLTKADVQWAVDNIHRGMRHIDLSGAFAEKIENMQGAH